MKIFLTNDDGWESPGIAHLAEVLEGSHEVWVFAPDRERSGQSHSITIKGPIRVRERKPRWYSCDGTPADCVNLGVRGGFVPQPDLVLSGINLGPNLGTDMIYSGTVAAARQAGLLGIPSLALSHSRLRGPWEMAAPAQWLAGNLPRLLESQRPGTFWNINFPEITLPQSYGRETWPAVRAYHDRIETFLAPGREHFCFFRGSLEEREPEAGSDWWTVNQGEVSLTRLAVQPLHVFEGSND